MNKRIGIFVVLLFLYIFCTFEPITLTEKGISLNSQEQLNKLYENHHKAYEKQNRLTKKLKIPKLLIKNRKKNKILEDDTTIINPPKKIIVRYKDLLK